MTKKCLLVALLLVILQAQFTVEARLRQPKLLVKQAGEAVDYFQHPRLSLAPYNLGRHETRRDSGWYDLKGYGITDIEGVTWPVNLILLDLANNFIRTISDDTIAMLLSLPDLYEILFINNPLDQDTKQRLRTAFGARVILD